MYMFMCMYFFVSLDESDDEEIAAAPVSKVTAAKQVKPDEVLCHLYV